MTTTLPEVDTNVGTSLLEELEWQPACDIGRALVIAEPGREPCPQEAVFTATVHRCSAPADGIHVLLCSDDTHHYVTMREMVKQALPLKAYCSYCHVHLQPDDVIRNVHPL